MFYGGACQEREAHRGSGRVGPPAPRLRLMQVFRPERFDRGVTAGTRSRAPRGRRGTNECDTLMVLSGRVPHSLAASAPPRGLGGGKASDIRLGGAGLIAINQRPFTGAISAGQQDMNGWTGYIPAGVNGLRRRNGRPHRHFAGSSHFAPHCHAFSTGTLKLYWREINAGVRVVLGRRTAAGRCGKRPGASLMRDPCGLATISASLAVGDQAVIGAEESGGEMAVVPLSTSHPGTQRIAAAVQASLDEMVAAATEAIWAEVPAYASSRDDQLREDVAAHVRAIFLAFLAGLTTGQPARRADFAVTREQATRRVAQGISLADFLQAFRIGQLTLWQGVLDAAGEDAAAREAALLVVAHIMQLIELGSTIAGEAYVAAQQHVLAEGDRVRRGPARRSAGPTCPDHRDGPPRLVQAEHGGVQVPADRGVP